MKNRDKPRWKFQQSTVLHKPGSLKHPHPPGIYPGYPKCIPADSPVSEQQDDTHLDRSPRQKKLAGSAGATGLQCAGLDFRFQATRLSNLQVDVCLYV